MLQLKELRVHDDSEKIKIQEVLTRFHYQADGDRQHREEDECSSTEVSSDSNCQDSREEHADDVIRSIISDKTLNRLLNKVPVFKFSIFTLFQPTKTSLCSIGSSLKWEF